MIPDSCWFQDRANVMYTVHDRIGYAFKIVISKAEKHGKIVHYVRKMVMGFRYALSPETQKLSH
jgi:hypothetical protein